MKISKQAFVSSLLLWVTLAPQAGAVRCGKWFSSDCLAETDVRYDKSYTNSIQEQDDIWSKFEGYWVNIGIKNIDSEGNARGPSFFLPYNRTALGFYNETFEGSRYFSSRYYIFEAADDAFCQLEVPPGSFFSNTRGEGVCGVNGWSNYAEQFGTSSYEKDGTISLFKATGQYSIPGVTSLVTSYFTPVDENTFTQTNILSEEYFVTVTYVFLRNFTAYSAVQQTFLLTDPTGNPLSAVFLNYVEKVTEPEWLERLEQAYVDFAVLPVDQVEGGQLPTQIECLSAGVEGCPTEDDWCKQDPECSESPFQEPSGTVKAGPIVGFVLAGAIFVFFGLYLWYRYKLKQQARRFKKKFARRVVGTMSVRASVSQLPPDALTNEFKRIAHGTKEGGGKGYITREDLWTFVSSEKAGKIEESDFDALFAAMDINDRGKVNFVDFCTFLGQCQDEFREARGVMDGEKGDKLSVAARRLSALPVNIPINELELEAGGTDE
jgi:hypothetical protein